LIVNNLIETLCLACSWDYQKITKAYLEKDAEVKTRSSMECAGTRQVHVTPCQPAWLLSLEKFAVFVNFGYAKSAIFSQVCVDQNSK